MKFPQKFLISCLFIAFTLSACTVKGNTEFPGDQITNDQLTVLEDNAYSFYYPTVFIEVESETSEYFYNSPELNELGSSNSIEVGKRESEEKGIKPLDEDCQALATQVASGYDSTINEVSVLDEGGMYGCQYSYQAVVNGVNFVFEGRTLYLQNGENVSFYAVAVTYEESTPEAEITNLQDALAKFKLK